MKRAILGLAALLALVLAAGRPATGPETPKALAAPERGFISSEPGATWEQGLLSGNGMIGSGGA